MHQAPFLRRHRGVILLGEVPHLLGLEAYELGEAIQRLPGVSVRRIGQGAADVVPEAPVLRLEREVSPGLLELVDQIIDERVLSEEQIQGVVA